MTDLDKLLKDFNCESTRIEFTVDGLNFILDVKDKQIRFINIQATKRKDIPNISLLLTTSEFKTLSNVMSKVTEVLNKYE